jgi:protoporphyrin/coproporphyrin ferrochelatase
MQYLILNQLGTPKAPTPEAVGIYLNEFLMDPRIISIPRPFRDLLVKIAIVPRRRFTSAEKYKEVWTEQGSPLAVHTEDLRRKLQSRLGGVQVLTAMRYGEPSIKTVLHKISKSDSKAEVYFLPLYPQYATATVASSTDEIEKFKTESSSKMPITVLPPFYDQAWYIEALANLTKPYLTPQSHLLLSYHGIPLSQEKNAPYSYKGHCEATTLGLVKQLNWPVENCTMAYQSRVGLNKWLTPSTADTAAQLAKQGVKHLKVACPSFVADCLETIEEIGMELRHTFIEAGGESFELIPCLNDDDLFVSGVMIYFQTTQAKAQQ